MPEDFDFGGEVVWQQRNFPKGSIVYADGCFYCYAETTGELALIEATTAGWKEKGRFRIPAESKEPRPPMILPSSSRGGCRIGVAAFNARPS